MESIEKKVVAYALVLMLVFAGLLAYSSAGLGIVLPTCNDRVPPFTEGKVIPKENNQFEVHYVARMWSFDPAELVLPEKADVDIYLSAVDVNHGFNIPGTNLNLMAVPGSVNNAHHRFDHKGEYLVICHEYCGLNHQNMVGKIRVVSAEDYAKWIQEQSGPPKLTGIAALGEKVAAAKDCSTCHTADGTEGIGPTFKGLFGKTEELKDESRVVVDEAYLIDSIKNPDSKLVEHFDPGSMPQSTLTDEEISQLIAYIKALK